MHTVGFGTGEIRISSLVSKDRVYKPMVKSNGGDRKSDGVIVPLIDGMNPSGGKGPDFDHVNGEGKNKGMVSNAHLNYPEGKNHFSSSNVRKLQNRLWAAAKQSEDRRFHALYDRIYRPDILLDAWERVSANKGSAGVDRVTLLLVEAYGVNQMLEEIHNDLYAGKYHPAPLRRVYIPKPDGTKRPLGIPTVKDRVVQAAAKIVLEPIFEADFLDCSYGFRPKRSATDAAEAIRVGFTKGNEFVFEADICNFFGAINHDQLMELVERRVSDRRVLKLLRQWLKAGVLEGGVVSETISGTPQGGVISPLLANIFLNAFDRAWQEKGTGQLVRYADDFVVLCKSQDQARKAHNGAIAIMNDLGLELHPDKTKVVNLRRGKEGFDFLGWHFHARMSGRLWEKYRKIRYYLHRWPSLRSMKRARARIKALTDRSKVGSDLGEIIERINSFLIGWGGYFRTGNSAVKFISLDNYVWWRLNRLLIKKRGRNLRANQVKKWTGEWFKNQGLHELMGTIRYPKAA